MSFKQLKTEESLIGISGDSVIENSMLSQSAKHIVEKPVVDDLMQNNNSRSVNMITHDLQELDLENEVLYLSDFEINQFITSKISNSQAQEDAKLSDFNTTENLQSFPQKNICSCLVPLAANALPYNQLLSVSPTMQMKAMIASNNNFSKFHEFNSLLNSKMEELISTLNHSEAVQKEFFKLRKKLEKILSLDKIIKIMNKAKKPIEYINLVAKQNIEMLDFIDHFNKFSSMAELNTGMKEKHSSRNFISGFKESKSTALIKPLINLKREHKFLLKKYEESTDNRFISKIVNEIKELDTQIAFLTNQNKELKLEYSIIEKQCSSKHNSALLLELEKANNESEILKRSIEKFTEKIAKNRQTIINYSQELMDKQMLVSDLQMVANKLNNLNLINSTAYELTQSKQYLETNSNTSKQFPKCMHTSKKFCRKTKSNNFDHSLNCSQDYNSNITVGMNYMNKTKYKFKSAQFDKAEISKSMLCSAKNENYSAEPNRNENSELGKLQSRIVSLQTLNQNMNNRRDFELRKMEQSRKKYQIKANEYTKTLEERKEYLRQILKECQLRGVENKFELTINEPPETGFELTSENIAILRDELLAKLALKDIDAESKYDYKLPLIKDQVSLKGIADTNYQLSISEKKEKFMENALDVEIVKSSK